MAAVLRQPHPVLPGPLQLPARVAVPGDPDRYPHRDEVASYLTRYAARLDANIRTGHRVTGVQHGDAGFEVELADGGALAARAVVAASGTFGHPYRPALTGLDGFTGTVLHAAEYRRPQPFTGQRVVVVGAGNPRCRSPPNSPHLPGSRSPAARR
ncbi:NAD(P)-binding domain-containing protein [Streptomyces rubiginosohelvolus]|uniref:NAD(P)-binding domain-containing protein n=1 Tax=Streptomyces rubiginosohelvolus TaxID=67362 RepID=UPI0036CE9B27